MWRKKAINLSQWRERVQEKLLENGIDQPLNSALLLLASALERDKTWVLSHTEYQPTPRETETIQTLSGQVAAGHPLPYVLGRWEFFGRKFRVTPDVLIPRPETETLVERVLEIASQFNQPKIVDVGTGSGAIAVSLGAELPQATIIACDISLPALRIAAENARQHAQNQIRFLQADLLAPLSSPFDLICANLPYIPKNMLEELAVSRWEPRLALDGGENGFELITPLLQQARKRLTPHGAILLEIEASLGAAGLSLAASHFPDAQISLIQDLAGQDRIIEIKRA